MTCLDHAGGYSLPVGFTHIAKAECYVDKTDGKQKRRSPISKNEYYRDLLAQAKRNQIPFKYVLRDVWYSAADNRFLDYAAEELNFLQKVGGGYVFIHRYLLEHFAEIAAENGYVAPAREN